ncbi:hypothetical protein CI109_102820 [Kwoniella shandongensis]|uniref:Uncharacterized protein n=1 Tax=Kwoniella shandongensis TaxID=1734106 RepID=A0A5M6C853_9TREE|nr:uncharacterized protein CI109_000011 [Kwoniella shandongensis]KAA5531173.1 hypothetical protein CI109_000011 [Kwoniella shandongensis]
MPSSVIPEEIQHPGAGTLFVYSSAPISTGGSSSSRRASPSGGGTGVRGSPNRGSKGRKSGSPFPSAGASTAAPPFGWVPTQWEDITATHEEPQIVRTPDSLLKHGISDYTYVPFSAGGVLGRGKFSTVYKVLGDDGKFRALKHTPLYPHHPLISARLLREPTLIAELPSHPCLIGVDGWVRTEGHFYLIEQYADSHIPLPNHPLPLSPSRAAYILDQLVSVVRDTLHEKGRVCHRDLKGDNVLIDVESGEILILDLGLSTRFSPSEPKLTTCCGSPAFHSPEIVLALARPPGEVTYYGPELDIWCIALTLLSLLLQVRFPLGPKHVSPYIMRERAADRLQELDELYPPHQPWRKRRGSKNDPDTVDLDFEKKEWARVRKAMGDFLEIDSKKRMEKFSRYDIGEKTRNRVQEWEEARGGDRKFKSTIFAPAEVKYTLPIYLDDETGSGSANGHSHGHGNGHGHGDKRKKDRIILRNPAGESERRVKSYLKYLLRSAGILYHIIPSQPSATNTPVLAPSAPGSSISSPKATAAPGPPTIFQLVVPLFDAPPVAPTPAPPIGWFPSLFSFHKSRNTTPPGTPTPRSVSSPPLKRQAQATQPSGPSPLTAKDQPVTGSGTKKSFDRVLRCYIKVEFEHCEVPISPRIPPNRRRASTETFTSMKDALGFAPLHAVSSNANASTQPQPVHGGGSASGASTPRSVSASRPNSTRPANRRALSHAPQGSSSSSSGGSAGGGGGNATTTARMPLNRLHTTISNASTQQPLSPLSRQVSLTSSPSSDVHVDPLSRAPSRASSRSARKTSGPQFSPLQRDPSSSTSSHPLFHQHHQHQLHQSSSSSSSSESRIIITLSDNRAYSVIRKALDVKPPSMSMDLTLSPLSIRRPSLAPSLTISVPDTEDGSHPRNVKSDEEKQEEDEPEPERERGRPRSKEDSSSLLSHLSKRKQQQSKTTTSPTSTSPKESDEVTTNGHINGDVNGDGKGKKGNHEQKERSTSTIKPSSKEKERDESRSRNSPRGLLEVIFGHRHNHSPTSPTTTTTTTRRETHYYNTRPHSARSTSMPPGFALTEYLSHHQM